MKILRRQTGWTLMETLVGLAIGVVVVWVAFQFLVNEQITLSRSMQKNASINGWLDMLQQMERDLHLAESVKWLDKEGLTLEVTKNKWVSDKPLPETILYNYTPSADGNSCSDSTCLLIRVANGVQQMTYGVFELQWCVPFVDFQKGCFPHVRSSEPIVETWAYYDEKKESLKDEPTSAVLRIRFVGWRKEGDRVSRAQLFQTAFHFRGGPVLETSDAF